MTCWNLVGHFLLICKIRSITNTLGSKAIGRTDFWLLVVASYCHIVGVPSNLEWRKGQCLYVCYWSNWRLTWLGQSSLPKASRVCTKLDWHQELGRSRWPRRWNGSLREMGGTESQGLTAILIANGSNIVLRFCVKRALKKSLSLLTPSQSLSERSGKTRFGTSRDVWVGSTRQRYMQPGSDAMSPRTVACIIDLVCRGLKSKELYRS